MNFDILGDMRIPFSVMRRLITDWQTFPYLSVNYEATAKTLGGLQFLEGIRLQYFPIASKAFKVPSTGFIRKWSCIQNFSTGTQVTLPSIICVYVCVYIYKDIDI